MRLGILGYGNLGKGVELAVKQNDDIELVAVFTRRNPETLKINSIIEEKKDEVPIEKKNSNVERIDDIQCNRLSTINPNGIN